MNLIILANFNRQVTHYSSKYHPMKEKLLIVFFAASFFAYNISSAQLIGQHDQTWKTIKTEHFDVVISAEQHDLGLYYAQAAEKAYQNLSGVFSQMTERIVLIVNDTTDVTNGFATRIPYPYIMAYSVPSNEHDSLSEAGDWARELITHELTHILQFEPATGFYAYLRPLFGTIIAPNMLTPAWWKEGMAVEMETQFTPRGRLRSTYQDASVRSFVLENKLSLQTIEKANEVLPSWPYGARPYLFGSLFFSQLNFETKDRKSTVQLANRQGERVPFFIEGPMNELTGRSYEMQYTAALHMAAENSNDQLKLLNSFELSDLEPIVQENESSFQPRYSEPHKLLALIESIEGKNTLTVLDADNKKMKLKNLPSGQIQSIDFHPTERKILYSLIDSIDSKHFFSDLYVYDLEKEKTERLTTAQRVRSATYSDDGARAVFVTTFGGQTQLRMMDIAKKEVHLVVNPELGTRYESPLFWDESNVLVVKVDAAGVRRLIKVNLEQKVESTVALDFPQIRFLNKIGTSLYFVSSKNGVNNIYVSDDLVTGVPVSHVLTGIWSYDISGDGNAAWTSLMTSEGFKVTKVKLSRFTQDLPVIENAIEKRYPAYSEPEFNPKKYETTDYEASGYLMPSYWIPFISTSSSSNGVFLQAQTTGHDPLNRHIYALSASYDSELKKGNFSGAYTNSTQAVPFLLSTTSQSRALGNAVNIVQTTTHGVSLLPDMFSTSRHLGAQLGVQLQETYLDSRSRHAGPFAQVVYKNYEQNIFQISPQSGWGGLVRLEKNYKVSDELLNVAEDYEKVSISWTGFASPWLPKHHALKAKVSGLATFSDGVRSRFGASSSSTFLEEDGLAPQFVMRGYSSAQFFGRSLWNTNLEYRFPIGRLDRGSGSDAYYLRRVSGAVIVDGIGVEGSGLDVNQSFQSLKLNESIWNSGVEFKLETTVGYILPMSFILGYYLPHSTVFASGSQLGLSLQIGGF